MQSTYPNRQRLHWYKAASYGHLIHGASIEVFIVFTFLAKQPCKVGQYSMSPYCRGEERTCSLPKAAYGGACALCIVSLSSVAFSTSASCSDRMDKERSSQLKALLMDYFETGLAADEAESVALDGQRGADEDLQDAKVRKGTSFFISWLGGKHLPMGRVAGT